MLVLPLLVSLIIQSQTVTVVEQNTLNDNQLVLDQSRDSIDRYLEELGLTLQRLTLNKAISTFFSMDRIGQGDPQVYKLIEAFDAISSYSVTNRFVIELLLYARNSDTLLSTKTVHTNINLDYKPFFRFGDIELAMWRSELLSRTYRVLTFRPEVITLYGVKRPCVVAYQSIPLNSGENSSGTVMALIDQGKIRELLAAILGKGGTVYVTDSDGNTLLSASDGPHPIPLSSVMAPHTGARLADAGTREKWVVSVATSSSYGWRYVSILPRGYVMAKVDGIKRVIWLVTVLFILVGIAAALFLAYRSSKPVAEIASLARSVLGDRDPSGEDLAYIKDSMLKLIAFNRQLEDARRREIPFTRSAFLEKLLRGTVHGEEDVATLVRYNEIELHGDRFVVFIVGIEGFGDLLRQDILKEMELNRILIKDTFTRRIPRNLYAVDLSLDRLAFVCSFDTAVMGVADLERTLLAVRDELRDSFRIGVVIAAGKVCTALPAIADSFGEAWKTLQASRRGDTETGVLHRDGSGENPDGFLYPLEREARLILLTRAGHDREVAEILQETYETNFVNRRLSPPVLQTLVACLIGTLMRLEADGEKAFTRKDGDRILEAADSPDAQFALVRSAFLQIAEAVSSRKRQTRERLVDRITAYVKGSASLPSLNLSMVASKFELKESYLYHFFKEAVGATFATYLESLRIDSACSLLCTTELAVDQISTRVGYSSAHSFRRAFKRCTALSPSEYQKANRQTKPAV